MRFKEIFATLLFLFLLIQGNTQVSFKEYTEISDATLKIIQAHDLCEYYTRNCTDSLKPLAVETLNFGNEKKNESLKYLSKRFFGCFLVRNGDFINGEKELKSALSFHRKIGDLANVTEDLNELGISNFLKGDFHSAESFFKLSLETGKDSQEETHSFLAELNLAKTYDKFDLKDKAKGIAHHYLKECQRLKKMESVSAAYGFLSDLALHEKNLKLAEEYLTKSLNSSKSIKSSPILAQIHSNFGAFYAAKEDFEKAKNHFNLALNLRKKSNNRKGILESYYNLGSVEYVENKYDKAEKLYVQGLLLAKEYNLFSDQIDFLDVLVEIQKEKKDKEKEIEYYQQFIDVKSKHAEFLLQNKEEQANLIEYFKDEKIGSKSEIAHQSHFWSGFLIGISSLLIVLLVFRFFKLKLISTENQVYDE
jgi:tetratricopeptide (TPR) repeat protein